MDAASVLACASQGGALLDAETVLLVNDNQGKVRKAHGFLEERVRAHDDQGRRRGHGLGDFSARSGGCRPGEQAHVGRVIAEGREQSPQGCGVLLSEHLGGCDEGPLVACGDDLQEGDERDDCFTGTHVSLQEALHGNLARQVRPNLVDRAPLSVRQREGQALDKTVNERHVSGRSQGRDRAHTPTLGGQSHLKNKGLCKRQRSACLLVVLVRLRTMQPTQALSVGADALALADRGGHRVGHVGVVEMVEHHADSTSNRP